MLPVLRSAARSLGKSPGFSAVAIGILALGIGASAVIFSVRQMVFETSVYDPAVFPFVPLLLALAAAVACLRPARRATQVDPLVARRRE